MASMTHAFRALALVALLTLAACGRGADQPRDAPEPAPAATAPAASAPAATTAPAMDWWFTTHGGSGELIYGDGDLAEGVSRLNLFCLPGSGSAQVDAGEGALALRSGDTAASFTAEDGQADVPLTSPVMQAFRRSGALAAGGQPLDLGRAGREPIERFFAYCGGAA